MKKALLPALLLHVFCVQSQTWNMTWAPNVNTVWQLYSTGSVMLMSSESGNYRSTDGFHWTNANIHPQFSANYSHMYYTGCGNRIYLSGTTLMHSDDGGVTWLQDTMANVRVAYSDGSVIFMATSTALYHSPDCGQTWFAMVSPATLQNYASGLTLFKGKLYMALQNGIYRYDASFNSWALITQLPPAGGPPYSYDDNNLYNDNDQYLYLSNGAGLFRTTADNIAWTDITPPYPQNIYNFRVINNEIYVCGERYTFKSSASAISWQLISKLRRTADAAMFKGSLFLGGDDGLLMHKTQTNTWDKMYDGVEPYGPASMFTSGDQLWAEGMMTRNYGTTWSTPVNDSLFVHAVSGNNLIVHGASPQGNPNTGARYYMSSNSGATWQTVSLYQPSHFALHGSHAFACSGDTIYRSSNGGALWSALHNFRYVQLLSAGTIAFIVKTDGTVHRSIDNGLSWQACTTPPSKTIQDSAAYPSRLYWNGKVLLYSNPSGNAWLSSDLGNSWQPVPLNGLKPAVRTTWAISPTHIYASGYTGLSNHTTVRHGIFQLALTDTTWQIVNGDSTVNTDFLIPQDNYLFISRRGVERLKTGPDPVSVADIRNDPQINLFPNPVSKNGVINISGNVAADVECYDACGRKMPVTPAAVSPGELRLSTQDLAPGVYFVHVRLSGLKKHFKVIVQEER